MSLLSEEVGCILEKIVENIELTQTFTIQNYDSSKYFNSVRAPDISIRDYLSRFYRYANCSDSCYVLAFIYLDRILQNCPRLTLTKRIIHRLLLAALVLAIKYSDDYYSDNVIYARIGGVPLAELNSLEANVLSLLQFNLHVDYKLYQQYVQELNLQYVKIMTEEKDSKKEDMTLGEADSKSLRTVLSMTSMRTMSSVNEMICNQL